MTESELNTIKTTIEIMNRILPLASKFVNAEQKEILEKNFQELKDMKEKYE